MPDTHFVAGGAYDAAVIARAAANTPSVLRVFVYGSAVWGGWEPMVSDIDLMVEGDAEAAGRLMEAVAGALGALDIRHAAELTWHHQADIRARGRLIYDRDSRESAGDRNAGEHAAG